ncbi:ribonuclease HII [Altibacter sp. HG106]|uniref:ribonuclease HII n=1 Tax=Altibacter sp. HG106 TaxID=3023937 RepID=UPI002350B0D7|nr:ribonuclease HII [Altibacter sp. HG106]MDC7995916.1 ribonuclease HII [Altibacter sp. HG106]
MLTPYISPARIECGTDEAGRGCLAGPVTAAAVILPKDFAHPMLNDSKQLSAKKREYLKKVIENEAISYAVVHVMMEEIDTMNILWASVAAMQRAIRKLTPTPDFIAVDGNRFKPVDDIPYECVIKGDGKYVHIAAASILAKTYRDAFMKRIHEEHPEYQWDRNKGYPTKAHRKALQEFGSTPYHRSSFQLLPKQLSFPL